MLVRQWQCPRCTWWQGCFGEDLPRLEQLRRPKDPIDRIRKEWLEGEPWTHCEFCGFPIQTWHLFEPGYVTWRDVEVRGPEQPDLAHQP